MNPGDNESGWLADDTLPHDHVPLRDNTRHRKVPGGTRKLSSAYTELIALATKRFGFSAPSCFWLRRRSYRLKYRISEGIYEIKVRQTGRRFEKARLEEASSEEARPEVSRSLALRMLASRRIA